MTNPLFRRIRELNREIARAEEHFGMTPLARLRLGVTYLQEQARPEQDGTAWMPLNMMPIGEGAVAMEERLARLQAAKATEGGG